MNEFILADTPLKDYHNDCLGYAPFAKGVAEAIRKVAVEEGIVFGLFAPWGTGKTTCLNFIQQYIKEYEDQTIIVEFNPWWFSGDRDLLRQFFKELKIALGKRETLKNIADKIAMYGEAISAIPEPTGVAKTIGALFSTVKTRDVQVGELKKDISKELEKINKRIVIIIDDIDRLSGEEIRSMFRVIKSVADFPKTIYLLALDKSVVVRALEDIQRISGEDYLEKIIQVPLELPMPDRASIRNLFLEIINNIFMNTSEKLMDRTYFQNVFFDGIEPFLKTGRNVKRLTNALRLSYVAVENEVNIVDFLAIETIRVFIPEVYYLIRSNPDMFTGYIDMYSGCKKDDLIAFHNKWLGNINDTNKEILKDLLTRIFPKFKSTYENINYGADWKSEWRKSLNICSEDIFPIYFKFFIPEENMSNVQVLSTLSFTSEAEIFSKKLLEFSKIKRYDGSTMVSTFIERMEDYTEEDIPICDINNIFQSFFNVGDVLLTTEDVSQGMFGYGNDTRMIRIIFQLLKRYHNSDDRYNVLAESIQNGKATSIIVSIVTVLGQQHGKYSGTKQLDERTNQLISIEQVEKLELIALNKIKSDAEKGILINTPQLASILYRWRDWENKDAPRNWILKHNILIENQNIVNILVGFLQKVGSYGIGDRGSKIEWRYNLDKMKSFVDPGIIIHKCRQIFNQHPEWLTGIKLIAIETFINEYEKAARQKS